MVRGKLGGVLDDVEVRQGGLDHDDVSALDNVALNSTPGEALALWWQLVAFTVSKRRCTARGVTEVSCQQRQLRYGQRLFLPERAIQRAGELGGVAHEGAFIAQACVNEGPLDSFDASVHHVARGNAVCTGFCIGQCNFGDASGRGFRVNGAVLEEHAAVSVGCVLAETDVCCDVERGVERAELLDSLNHRSFGVICGSTLAILEACADVNWLPGEDGYAHIHTFSHLNGTPKRITLLRPFLTNGPMNSSSLFTPQRHWPGREGISTRASGSSVMKMGYMSIPFVRVRFACHDRERGCW